MQQVSFSFVDIGRLVPALYDQRAFRRAIEADLPLEDFLARLNQLGRQYKAALEHELRSSTDYEGWEVPVHEYRIGEAFGGELERDIAYLAVEATRLGDAILTWVGLAAIARAGLRRLTELAGREPGVSDGMAALLASDAIFAPASLTAAGSQLRT